MADFLTAFAITMKAEGGYANDPDDSGGETYKGVSRKNNLKWAGWKIIDAVKATHPTNINVALSQRNDLQELIHQFYQQNYWNVNQTGLINDQQIANQVFDTAVNCGAGTAARFLQRAAGTTADGIIGNQTLKAVNNANAENLYHTFLAERKQYYVDIISRNPSQAKFQKSWFSRLTPYVKAPAG